MATHAVFIDRDGVINKFKGYITSPEEIELIEGSAEAIAMLNKAYKVIVVSNQPCVGKGLCTERDIAAINKRLLALLREHNARIDATYMCFHHPLDGIGKYKRECDCRKPKPGLLLKAAKEHNIELSKSFMVGDRTSDIKAGRLAGVKTILVKTGFGGDDGYKDATPDYVAEDLYDAARIILGVNK